MAGLKRTFDEFVIDGQRYERIGEEAFNTAHGRIAVLVSWRTRCADCDTEFVYVSKSRPAPEHPTRRCTPCGRTTTRKVAVNLLASKTTKSTGVTSGLPETLAIDVGRDAMRLNKVLEGALRRSVRVDAHATRPTTPHKPDVFTDR